MKYIITEDQNQRIVRHIVKYLDKYLTPYGGWTTPEEYERALGWSEDELFLFLVDTEGSGEDAHMWYSTYKNPNADVKEEDSPIVLIPDEIESLLDGLFNELWKPVFIEWFEKNTGLPVTKVQGFGW